MCSSQKSPSRRRLSNAENATPQCNEPLSRQFESSFLGMNAALPIGMDANEVRDNFSRINRRVDERFAQIDQRFDEMRRLILGEGERTRKHMDSVAERLYERIGLIGETFAELKIGNIEIKDCLDRLESGQDRLEVRLLAVESRATNIEKTEKVILAEVRGLATRVERSFKPRQRR
jgi:hypothetical protein